MELKGEEHVDVDVLFGSRAKAAVAPMCTMKPVQGVEPQLHSLLTSALVPLPHAAAVLSAGK
jgi:hypothetical protein